MVLRAVLVAVTAALCALALTTASRPTGPIGEPAAPLTAAR